MYILSPIANTVLRNATGYFSFHYRRYFRTPSLSCPITLSGTPPISSAMSRGRGLKVLLRTLFPPALCGYLPSLLLLRNIGETQKKQSFLRKGIRGMKRQSPPISY